MIVEVSVTVVVNVDVASRVRQISVVSLIFVLVPTKSRLTSGRSIYCSRGRRDRISDRGNSAVCRY